MKRPSPTTSGVLNAPRKGPAMNLAHAVPMSTIATGELICESHGLMVGHREEAQRILDRELNAGLSPRHALAKAAQAIRAGRRAQIMHLAELPYVTA